MAALENKYKHLHISQRESQWENTYYLCPEATAGSMQHLPNAKWGEGNIAGPSMQVSPQKFVPQAETGELPC